MCYCHGLQDLRPRRGVVGAEVQESRYDGRGQHGVRGLDLCHRHDVAANAARLAALILHEGDGQTVSKAFGRVGVRTGPAPGAPFRRHQREMRSHGGKERREQAAARCPAGAA
eukprot:31152-Chlamydomonas_euryale.AAC.5